MANFYFHQLKMTFAIISKRIILTFEFIHDNNQYVFLIKAFFDCKNLDKVESGT